jgi:hypothetical protein
VAPAILTLFLVPALVSYFFDCRGLADEVNGVAPWAVDVLLGLVVRF